MQDIRGPVHADAKRELPQSTEVCPKSPFRAKEFLPGGCTS
jgi:hypothetical protein